MDSTPIEVVMITRVKGEDKKQIYSIKQVEWRHLLVFGRININLEMLAVESARSVGILEVLLELDPRGQILKESQLNQQLAAE